MISEALDNMSMTELLGTAWKGSRYAYGCAWAKVIEGKKAYQSIKIVMSQSERDTFWSNIKNWSTQLQQIRDRFGF